MLKTPKPKVVLPLSANTMAAIALLLMEKVPERRMRRGWGEATNC